MVPRPRIVRLLEAAWERRITLVVAGGGYGKTTALRQLAAGPGSRWIALTAADREVETLAARVAEAVDAGARPAPAASTAGIGASDRRSLAEGRAALICEGLDSEDDQLVLILDDVDQLADDDSASQFLSTLCLQAPSRLHLVLSGRQLPSLGLGSASGRGELMEINAPDLAFTTEETASLLVERLGTGSGSLADRCWSLTGGWAAALQLIVDRLERLDPARWHQTLTQLQHRHGSLWREFTADVIDREEPSARRILAVACRSGRHVDLLVALGIASAESELDSLQTRGLLVATGDERRADALPGCGEGGCGAASRNRGRRASPKEPRSGLSGAVASRRRSSAPSLGPRPEALSLLGRCGETLVARGYGSRVAEVLRDLGTGDDLGLDTILAQALVAVGDWDGAMDVFRAIQRSAAGARLPAAIAWRFGALLYLRSDFEGAQEVLSAAYSEDPARAHMRSSQPG